MLQKESIDNVKSLTVGGAMNIRSFRKDGIMDNPFNMNAVKLLDLPEGEIIHLSLDAGEEMVPHIPPVTLAIYVLEGDLWVELDGKPEVLAADDCLEVPEGIILKGGNPGTRVTRVLICRIPRPLTAPVIVE